MIEDVLDTLEEVGRYSYSIIVSDSPKLVPFDIYSNQEFFYILDKGDPLYNITPRRLTERMENYFQDVIEPQLSDELAYKAFNLKLNDSEIRPIFEKYSNQMEQHLRNLIRTDVHKIAFTLDEDKKYVDFNSLANTISCKVVKK